MTQHERDIYNSEIHGDNQIVRDNNIASTGLLLGILLVGLGVGAFFLTQENNPNPSQTTIIEKTQKVVPVPQPKAPDVNITVPNPEPVKMPDVNINIPSSAPQNNTPASEPATAKPEN